jgi:pimeloyl-ACP methyl ester carboxylesterase
VSSGERFARAGEIELCYETFGDESDPTLLLIMGLNAQMVLWDDEFCATLAGRGFHVIRFDNRDIGRSTRIHGRPPTPSQLLRRKIDPVLYRLSDMADDDAGLLRELGLAPAHIVGASMGGMIAQIFAARFQQRTRSLAVIFSSNNRAFLPPPHPSALFAVLRGPSPNSPIEVIADYSVKVWRIIGSPRYPAPEQRLRDEAIQGYERCYYPWGTARHFSAIIASGSLAHYDRQITAPTIVLHGKADKLQRPFGGRVVARTIPGARLRLFDGMGHDLPEELWDDVIGELTTTFTEA